MKEAGQGKHICKVRFDSTDHLVFLCEKDHLLKVKEAKNLRIGKEQGYGGFVTALNLECDRCDLMIYKKFYWDHPKISLIVTDALKGKGM